MPKVIHKANIRGFVKFKGKIGLSEFYNKDEKGNTQYGRKYLQMLIDEHETIMGISSTLKPSLYRFEITNYKKGKVLSYKKSAYFKSGSKWQLLGRSEKTFED